MPLFKGYPSRQGAASRPSTCISRQRAGRPRHPRPARCSGRATSSGSTPPASSTAGAATRPSRYPVGKIRPEVQRLLDVTAACCDLAIDLMAQRDAAGARWPREMDSYVRDARLHAWSRTSSATASAARCTKIRRCPTSSAAQLRGSGDFRLEPGLVIAVEPMVNMGTKRVKMLPRPLDAVDRATACRAPTSSTRSPSRATARRADRGPHAGRSGEPGGPDGGAVRTLRM